VTEASEIIFLWYPRALTEDLYAHATVSQLRAQVGAGTLGAPDVRSDEGLARLLDDWIARGYKDTLFALIDWPTPQEALLSYELLVDATLQLEWRAPIDLFLRHARVLASAAAGPLDRAALTAVYAANRRGDFYWRTWPPLATLVADDSPVLDWDRWRTLFPAATPKPMRWPRRRSEESQRQVYERFAELRAKLLEGEQQGWQVVIASSEENLCPYPVPNALRAATEQVVTHYYEILEQAGASHERRRRVLRVVAPVIIVGLVLVYTAAIVLALPGGALWWIPLVALVLAVLFWQMRRPA